MDVDESSSPKSPMCESPEPSTSSEPDNTFTIANANRRLFPDLGTEIVHSDDLPKLREILVDWLVFVAEAYEFTSGTLYLTVSYVDRFLSSRAINGNRLQLLGVSSMLTASKHEEEISKPTVKTFCSMTENSYTPEEVVYMEREIVFLLEFEFSIPTAITVLREFMEPTPTNLPDPQFCLEMRYLAYYLLELSLLDYRCQQFTPSVAAASALFLSRFTRRPRTVPWISTLQSRTQLWPSDIQDCVLAMRDLQLNVKESPLRAVRQKYSQAKERKYLPQFLSIISTLSPFDPF